MHRRRLIALLASTALLLGGVSATAAVAVDLVSSDGVHVEGVATIGQSESVDGDGSATGLSVLGQDVVQTDEGSDALLSSEELGVPADALEVDVVRADADPDDPDEPDASTSALSVGVGGDEGLQVDVVTTEATSGSDGSGRSSLADVGGGGGALDVSVGESELERDGGEQSATTELVSVNDTAIGSDEQVDGAFCDTDLSPLADLSLICVQSEGSRLVGGIGSSISLLDGNLTGLVSTVQGDPDAEAPDDPDGDDDTTPESPAPSDDDTQDDTQDDGTSDGDAGALPAPDAGDDVASGALSGAPNGGPSSLSSTGVGILGGLVFGTASIGSGAALLRRRDED